MTRAESYGPWAVASDHHDLSYPTLYHIIIIIIFNTFATTNPLLQVEWILVSYILFSRVQYIVHAAIPLILISANVNTRVELSSEGGGRVGSGLFGPLAVW